MSQVTPVHLPKRSHLALSAALSGLAVIGSYLVTLAVAAACFVLPVLLLSASFHAQFLIVLAGGWVMGFTLLWAMIPRSIEFETPGPQITAEQEPELIAEIGKIAGAVGQEPPAEVYLLLDANAWVTERGGWCGIGSRRILAVGLPLMWTMSVAELRSVIAHEFGHYYQGDTRLAPWVYRARVTIARSVEGLAEDSGVLDFLSRWWVVAIPRRLMLSGLAALWKLFMRVTLASSRQQEFRADELACAVAGSNATVEGLKKVHLASAVLNPYLNHWIVPVLEGGRRPAMASGFVDFLNEPHISAQALEIVQQEIGGEADAFDTHPPLGARIDAAQKHKYQARAGDDRPAAALLRNPGKWEAQLLASALPAIEIGNLPEVAAERIGSDIFVPQWRETVAEHSGVLRDKKLIQVPALLADHQAIAAKICKPELNPEDKRQQVAYLLQCAVKLALIEAGWTLDLRPASTSLRLGQHTIFPNQWIHQLARSEVAPSAWSAVVAELGIGEVPLLSAEIA